MTSYRTSLTNLSSAQFHPGFFDGWWNAPSPDTHVRILEGSTHFVLALDDTGQVIGFVTAVSDGVMYASVTLLEVVPEHKGCGIGRELMERITGLLGPIYRTDIACDGDVIDFYAKVGYEPLPEMRMVTRMLRSHQPGRLRDRSPANPRTGTEH